MSFAQRSFYIRICVDNRKNRVFSGLHCITLSKRFMDTPRWRVEHHCERETKKADASMHCVVLQHVGLQVSGLIAKVLCEPDKLPYNMSSDDL